MKEKYRETSMNCRHSTTPNSFHTHFYTPVERHVTSVHPSINSFLYTPCLHRLEIFFFNFAQMFAIPRQCAELINLSCALKVKVILHGQSSNDSIPCPLCNFHYENTPIQIYWEIYHQKMETFRWKFLIFFLISAQNLDCGYSLEPPRWGGSNEYPQSMFLNRNKKNNIYPCKPQFYYIKVGFKGVKII